METQNRDKETRKAGWDGGREKVRNQGRSCISGDRDRDGRRFRDGEMQREKGETIEGIQKEGDLLLSLTLSSLSLQDFHKVRRCLTMHSSPSDSGEESETSPCPPSEMQKKNHPTRNP